MFSTGLGSGAELSSVNASFDEGTVNSLYRFFMRYMIPDFVLGSFEALERDVGEQNGRVWNRVLVAWNPEYAGHMQRRGST